MIVVVILRFPHLMLADISDDDGFASGFFPEVVDDMGRVEVPTIGQALNVADGGITFQLSDMANPGVMVAGFDVWCETFEHLARISN